MKVGTDSFILSPSVLVEVAPGAELTIGNNVSLRRFTTISVRERVTIGDDALIAEMVTIRDHDDAIVPGVLYRTSGFVSAAVEIRRNVRIGNKVTITAGATIGENAIVAANAVVTRDLPANSISAGVPAKPIRSVGREVAT